MFTIRALACSPSVKIGTCQLKSDFAFTFKFIKAPARSADVTCSPDERRTSHSLSLNFFETSLDSLISSLVFPDIAETTAITLFPIDCSFLIMVATCWILSVVPTDVPPNFNIFLTI